MPRDGHGRRNARWRQSAFLLAALSFVAACARRPAYRVPVPSTVPPPKSGWSQEGIASWYGRPFYGRRAADGEIYDMYKMVAAHRTLPFNSLVRVTDLQNGRQVTVRIIDRGPFVKNRIIDLSFGAARALDMVGPGVAPVRLQLVSGQNPEAGEFTVQVGAFAVHANALRLQKRLGERYGPVFIQNYDSPHGLLYRVRVGEVPSVAAARRLAAKLRAQQAFRVTYVVRLDR